MGAVVRDGVGGGEQSGLTARNRWSNVKGHFTHDYQALKKHKTSSHLEQRHHCLDVNLGWSQQRLPQSTSCGRSRRRR
jgi:hypothetical protein